MNRLATPRRWALASLDLLVVAGYCVVAAATLPTLVGPVRTVIGLPLVLFVPGYVLLAILFPRRADAGGGPTRAVPESVTGRREPTLGERLGLSVAASLALVAVVALAVTAFTTEIGVRAVTWSLVGASLAGTAAAVARRLAVPEADRFRMPWRAATHAWRATTPSGRVDAIVTVVLVVGVLGAASAMAYSVAAPDRGAAYTDFAVLAENESGELVAGGYPTTFGPGESHRLTAQVANHEGGTVEYTVVVEVQRVRPGGDDQVVVEQREVLRRVRTVEAGATWQPSHVVDPTLTGEDLRLAYYLYRGDAPGDAAPGTAYRRLHLWIDASGGANVTAAVAPGR